MSAAADQSATPAEAKRFVRPYALTGGRTRSRGTNLGLETLITATETGRDAAAKLSPEQRQIVLLCSRPLSIAEISARLGVPLGVARVLASDLRADGLVEAHRSPAAENGEDLKSVLERVLHGLESL
jgi:DNA-directed RNA polymerase specialized sigma24 family protein